jgi:hypothetical protein
VFESPRAHHFLPEHSPRVLANQGNFPSVPGYQDGHKRDLAVDMPTDQYELYAQFGIAAEKAQVMEVAAGNVVLSFLVMLLKPDPNQIAPEETQMYRALIDDLNRKTFGSLLNHLKKMVNLSDSMIQLVDEALERRNYLTHHFFRTHNFALYSEDGRKVMIAELKEIQGKLEIAHRTLEVMATLIDQVAGRTTDDGMVERLVAGGRKINI